MRYRKIIRGKNCSLERLRRNDEKAVGLFKSLFNEKEIAVFLNPEYLKHKTTSRIKKWIDKKTENPVEVWYVIKKKSDYIGYICFKWRKHYDEACEISTAIEKNYRGLKLGYESSRIMVNYILSLNKFKYVAAYFYYTNKKAEKNLRKLGFVKANRLNKIITKEFYGDDGSNKEERVYNLMIVKQ
ncbi:MAG TPA: GNAT family N-acetyltransferase [Ignavibacteria bacterium]|nr:GNAT family N-acetyltransferase [Ignavibacteria bacterium]